MNGLPPIDQSLLPADVRKGSASDRKEYAAALGFERQLVNEMTKAMTDTAKPVDGGDDDSDSSGDSQDAGTSMYMQMFPDQLADSITQNGGLGLARTFYNSMKERGQ
jgi:Rod binding domain-containing protein